MKILLNASYAPSLLNFRGPLIRALAGAGHQVHVTAPDISPEVRTSLQLLGAEAHEVPLSRKGLNPIGDYGYFRALQQVGRGIGVERVISYTIKPCIWGSLAAYSIGVPSASLVTGLGYAFNSSPGVKARAVSLVSRQLWRLATAANDIVFFQNPDDRAEFIETGCLADPAKARLVSGSGVDLSHYAPAPLPERPVFLMIARIIGSKGVREYARAAMRLLAEGRDWSFLLVGSRDEGPDSVSPEELDQWVTGGLEYLGELSDVRPALARANVYVLPSYYREGTPRSILEAMAMGRAIITTDAPGCRETVRDGVNGLFVPPRDEVALEQAMVRLGTDDKVRARMGEESLAYATRKYDVNIVNRSMMDSLGL